MTLWAVRGISSEYGKAVTALSEVGGAVDHNVETVLAALGFEGDEPTSASDEAKAIIAGSIERVRGLENSLRLSVRGAISPGSVDTGFAFSRSQIFDYERAADQIIRTGLLFTFLGLTGALLWATKTLGSDVENMTENISGLLHLSGNKFIVSVVAIFFAILVHVVGHNRYHALNHKAQELERKIFVQRSLIRQSTSRRNDDAELSERLDALTSKLQSGLNGVVAELRITGRSLVEGHETMFNSIGVQVEAHMLQELREGMGVFRELAQVERLERQALSEHVSTMNEVATQFADAMAVLKRASNALEEAKVELTAAMAGNSTDSQDCV